jgi:hypothetical protein
MSHDHGTPDDAELSAYYRRHAHLPRTHLYHRARSLGVEGAASLSKAELIHALARLELHATAA